MDDSLRTGRFESWDGTEIAYYTGGHPEGPPMVLCGGLGGGVEVWRPVFERFGDRFRISTWDYRGLYASAPAAEPGAYRIRDHTRDLARLLRHLHMREPVIVGWSMGVQVALELHRRHSNRPRALVAIHGIAGRPLATAFDSPLPGLVAPLALGALRLVGRRLTRVGPMLARSSLVVNGFVGLGRSLGVMAESMQIDGFQRVAERWTALDLATYATCFDELNAHDAGDVLDAIDTPTLVIAGDADRFTPAHVSQAMAKALPDARLEIIPGATHFGLLEHPEAIVAAMDAFLCERLGEAAKPAAQRQPS